MTETSGLSCSFCGKDEHDGVRLIAGPAVYICDQCLGLCAELIGRHIPWRRTDDAPEDAWRAAPQPDREAVAMVLIDRIELYRKKQAHWRGHGMTQLADEADDLIAATGAAIDVLIGLEMSDEKRKHDPVDESRRWLMEEGDDDGR